jgi:hypothetical protein
MYIEKQLISFVGVACATSLNRQVRFRPVCFFVLSFERFTLLVLIGSLQHGSCVIQPTELSFPVEELVRMIHQCGLNRLNQFGSFLGNNLRASRADPKVLSLLASLDEILYSGLSLAREDEEWAYKNGLSLRVCLFLIPAQRMA